MFADFASGVLHRTDYFSSRDREQGRAWLVIHTCDWHVLLPHLPSSRLEVAHARPVTDCQERDGWRWRLELGDWFLPLPRCRIIGPRPRLPEPYTRSERTLTLYGAELAAASGQSFFGNVHPGLQIHSTCRLWLVRDTRHGDKAHDQLRRRERFRQQRPGDA